MSTDSTRTYALVEVSAGAFAEIEGKLRAAGYDHVFGENKGRPIIDMIGLALVAKVSGPSVPGPDSPDYVEPAGSVFSDPDRPPVVSDQASKSE